MEYPSSKSLPMLKRLPDNASMDIMKSPVGDLTLIADDKCLLAVLWERDWDNPETAAVLETLPRKKKHEVLTETRRQLKEYFKGQRKTFDLPLKMDGTDFQKSAWKVLKTIPYGQTMSYKEQAIRLGDKNKVRAVGGANGRNPISIVVPCHRVIAHSGDLTGFGGGLHKKSFLLDFESANI